MKRSKRILLSGLVGTMLIACGPQTNKKEVEKESVVVEKAVEKTVSGNYVTPDYFKRSEGYDWVGVKVEQQDEKQLAIAVRSRADKKRPTCTWDVTAREISEGVFRAVVDGKPVLFVFEDDQLTIKPEKAEDEGVLYFYCSGGATVAGSYQKIAEELDPEQVDQTLFSQVLQLQGIGFHVSSKMKEGKNWLTIAPFGLEISNRSVEHEMDGQVVWAEVEDLNSDGSPEVVVFIRNEETTKGSVIAYSVNNRKSMSDVYFQDIKFDSSINQGYEGGDEFAIVETTLSQRFPIAGTNKIRQVNYEMVNGESSRVFKVKSVNEFERP